MKHSLKKIFQNINMYMFYLLFASFIFVMLTLEQKLSYDKVTNLNNQKNIISITKNLNLDDSELLLLQVNANYAKVMTLIVELEDIYKYSFVEQYILNNQQEYKQSLNQLNTLNSAFYKNTHDYFTHLKDSLKASKYKIQMNHSASALTEAINNIILKNVTYTQEKFDIFKYFSLFTFIVVVIATLVYRRRIYYIYQDILYLISLESKKATHDFYTQEMDAINLRMKRKTVLTDNPTMTDSVTGIYNYKGLVESYGVKRGMKDSYFTCVTLFEIENFSKTKRTYSQEVTQLILKKIAFTISLYEKPTDVIARTDYNQFTIILSRVSKEQCMKDSEIIKQSIEELQLNLPNNEKITLFGGIIIKPTNTHLEEALKQVKEILESAKKIGNNKLLHTNTMANSRP